MKPDDPPARRVRWVRPLLVAVLLAGVAPAGPVTGRDGIKPADETTPKKPAQDPGVVEVRFTDNSNLKLLLRDEKLEVTTAYGTLLIPVADVRKIEFGTRVADDVAKRVEAAIANLGSQEFKLREAATAELLALKEKAYPALVKAAKHADAEVARRAEDLLAKVRETVPEDQLQIREHDVVYTDDMKLVGRITVTSLRVNTAQFGEQQVRLADVRSLRSLALVEETEPKNVMPDPGSVTNFQTQIGKSFHFKVTGALNGSVWGTDVYTSDSSLATVAVHAGILTPGQTGVVKVTIVAPPPTFQGSSRNGVNSAPYGAYPGAYQVSK